MSDSRVVLRPLESALFEVPGARVQLGRTADVPRCLGRARELGAARMVMRVAADDSRNVRAVEEAAGRLCDVLVTYERMILPDASIVNAVSGPEAVATVRVAEHADGDRLRDIAHAAFSGGAGHWHADPRLSSSRSTELYARWATDLPRSSSPRSRLLVAQVGDVPIGFLALALNEGDDGWHVPLTAVHPQFQGRGVLRLMLDAALAELVTCGATRFHYETQLTNWSAIRVIASVGFRPVSARMTFHLWLPVL